MPSPTFVTNYGSAFSTTTTPKTASVSVADGDTLVVAVVADGGVLTPTISGGGLTYTSRALVNTGTEAFIGIYVAESNSAQTFTLSVAVTGGHMYGFDALRFSNARDAARGATATVDSTDNGYVSLTTLNANSTVVSALGDFNANAATSRGWSEDGLTTPVAGTETDFINSSPNYTGGIGYWADAGTAAAHTFGLRNDLGGWGHATVGAVEIKYQAVTGALTGTASVTGTATITAAGTVDVGTTRTVTATITAAGTVGGSFTHQAKPAAYAWSGAAPSLDIVTQVDGNGPVAVSWAGTNATVSGTAPRTATLTGTATLTTAGTVGKSSGATLTTTATLTATPLIPVARTGMFFSVP